MQNGGVASERDSLREQPRKPNIREIRVPLSVCNGRGSFIFRFFLPFFFERRISNSENCKCTRKCKFVNFKCRKLSTLDGKTTRYCLYVRGEEIREEECEDDAVTCLRRPRVF